MIAHGPHMVMCPNCKTIQKAGEVCPNCKYPIPDDRDPKPAPPAIDSCSVCGRARVEGRRCTHCKEK